MSCGHASVLVDRKLYISGGIFFESGPVNLNDFFYLDVSQNFTITALPWNNLIFTGAPQNAITSACSGGNNNDLIFIFGGLNNVYENSPFTSKFDISNQYWTNVTSGENEPTKRDSIACAKFNHGSIEIFAGFNQHQIITNEFWIFNSLELTWSLSNASNAPQSFWGYCAITLPDETILYIGGAIYEAFESVPMNNLQLYDTSSNTWKSLNTTGPTPPGRRYFSAVLTSDKRIIIFGGKGDDESVLGDLWILDAESYQWSAGNIPNPNGIALWMHTANLVDNYMIVAFGKILACITL
ncbi:16913_t:CDS:2 [Gigaspora margarita]|uniref:16913_t:CDS:1 n=1 Tax=Gigaspora margarita TaxID=4874 RepID=A0ABM8VZP9_GIGMA|nr:16913_t:CDS:2 [Gigaspora margarita]